MKKLRIGVAGLGRAFSLMASAFRDPRVQLVAAADARPEALEQFQKEYRGRAFPSVEAMSGDPGIDLVYVATPHELHAPMPAPRSPPGKACWSRSRWRSPSRTRGA
jgi:phthalate 4,5-cis-dihydrodiol dehydrogenase